MITARDLDSRLTYRELNSTPFTQSELVAFTSDLHALLMQEGFAEACPLELTGARSQDVWLRMAPGGGGIVRVTIRYDGHIYTDRGCDIPRIITGQFGECSIQALVDSLHAAKQWLVVKEYCGTCYYCDDGAQHCGMGRPLTASDCTDYVSRTQP